MTLEGTQTPPGGNVAQVPANAEARETRSTGLSCNLRSSSPAISHSSFTKLTTSLALALPQPASLGRWMNIGFTLVS